jgi:hypothetical protein
MKIQLKYRPLQHVINNTGFDGMRSSVTVAMFPVPVFVQSTEDWKTGRPGDLACPPGNNQL